MESHAGFVDIHCHLLPEMDDGASSWDESLEMARIAVKDGLTRAILTPHQLGGYRQNTADRIRQQATQYRERLEAVGIELEIAVGGDVRIEPDVVERLLDDEILSLADRGCHVLLELPHELYFPLEPLIARLRRHGYTGVLSHPERNLGILADPVVVRGLVDAGCLMQVTAASLLGAFGAPAKQLAESMLYDGLVHVIATDAHGADARRPLMSQSYNYLASLAGVRVAQDLCCENTRRIFDGEDVVAGRREGIRRPRRWFGLART